LIAGCTEPYGTVGKDLIAEAGPYHGNDLTWGEIHVNAHRAGGTAVAALDAAKQLFSVSHSGDLLSEILVKVFFQLDLHALEQIIIRELFHIYYWY
jgi:hypothetical protein